MRTNEQRRTMNDAARQLRFRQGRRNQNERRAIVDVIEENIPYAPRLIEFPNEITLRTEHDEEIFKAKYLRTSTHFPGIVPELVSDNGLDYMLITWLTYGSLLRLLTEVRRGERIKNYRFFIS